MKNFLFIIICSFIFNGAISQPFHPTYQNEAVKFDLGIASYAFRKKPLEEVLHLA